MRVTSLKCGTIAIFGLLMPLCLFAQSVNVDLNASTGAAAGAPAASFDIDPFVLALTDPAGYDVAFPDCDIMLADANGDGAVNNFDIDAFVTLLIGP